MLWRYVWFSRMVARRHLEFDPTGNGAIRSAVPENPSLEPNGKSIGRRVVEIWPFVIACNIWLSILSNVRICEYEYQTNLTDVYDCNLYMKVVHDEIQASSS